MVWCSELAVLGKIVLNLPVVFPQHIPKLEGTKGTWGSSLISVPRDNQKGPSANTICNDVQLK